MKIFILLISIIAVPVSTLAQGSSEPPRRNWGYGFAGVHKVGNATLLSRAGFGWEWLIFKDLAIGLEGAGKSGRAESSVNLAYHFQNIPKLGPQFVPFVTGGGTLDWGGSDGGVAAGDLRYNVGAGTSVWLHRHIGPRVEVRKYGTRSGDSDMELRIGVTFRY